MVDHELQYLGQFPVQLSSTELRTDLNGQAQIELPAASQPSRYLLTVFASDGAAYRVRSSKEILIERGARQYRLAGERRFSAAGSRVRFAFAAEGPTRDGAEAAPPQRYAWVRLEDQSRGEGELSAQAQSFELALAQPGTYSISLLDARGQVLGATAHAVSGAGVKAVPGSIEIVLDRPEYAAGDTAEALLTFPEPVEEALLTLERDKVESSALLSAGADWLSVERLSETQFRARIPVAAGFAPNLTFSALYTRGGDYAFQNAGIKVRMPAIEVAVRAEREVYRPGETVNLEFETRLEGRPVPARLTVSVVDEMIYALQPEIAPAIGEFFFHPRRNNVRTSASLSFISYDVALPGRPSAPPSGNRSERGVKVLERPRREEVDTAAWVPDLQTDAEGRARISFRMPDSLTRWRITARAVAEDGLVGQRREFVRSEQPLYLKWTGPKQFRSGDAPQLGLLAFNQGEQALEVELLTRWQGESQRQPQRLERGANYLPLPAAIGNSTGTLEAELQMQGQRADALAVELQALPASWTARSSLLLHPQEAQTPLALPADATAIELTLAAGGKALFRSALDALVSYPHGCVEQTASRLLPLSMAFESLDDAAPAQRDRLRLVLQQGRLRLMHLAGPGAHFGWWGEGSAEDAFLTAYAYYADYHASRALGIELPASHFERVLGLYSEQAGSLSPLKRVLVLELAAQMQLPVKSLLEGALSALVEAAPASGEAIDDPRTSLVLTAPDSRLGRAAALLLGLHRAERIKAAVPEALQAQRAEALEVLAESPLPFAAALRLHIGELPASAAGELLAQLAPEDSTLERALALSWLAGAASAEGAALPEPGPGWKRLPQDTLGARWRWQADAPPTQLKLKSAADAGVVARLSYASAESAGALPVQIERRLWRLVPGAAAFDFSLEAVAPGEALLSSALYLDEISLSHASETPLRYGLVEVPLPPGADVERTTWGLNLISGPGGVAAPSLERARHEPGQLGYTLPVDTLAGSLTFRHLVRFSQRGQFQLPPVRISRMYAPADQAWEAQPALSELVVE
jgi:alpha-2-macroglobulin